MTRKTPADPVIAYARTLGCDLEWNKKTSHWRVTYQGRYVGTIPTTPSCPHAMLNARTLIRRNIARITEPDDREN